MPRLDESFRKSACQVFRYTSFPRSIDNSTSKLAKIHRVLRTKHLQSFLSNRCLLHAAFLSNTLPPINLTQLLLICISCSSPKNSKEHHKPRLRCRGLKRQAIRLWRRNDRLVRALLLRNEMEKRVSWKFLLTSLDIQRINAIFLRKISNPSLNSFRVNEYFQRMTLPQADRHRGKGEANLSVGFPGQQKPQIKLRPTILNTPMDYDAQSFLFQSKFQ